MTNIKWEANRKKEHCVLVSQNRRIHFIPPNEILFTNGAVLIFSLLFTYPVQYNDEEGNVKNLWDLLLAKRHLSMRHEWRAELAFRFSSFFGRMGTPDPQDRKATREWIKGKIKSLRDESED